MKNEIKIDEVNITNWINSYLHLDLNEKCRKCIDGPAYVDMYHFTILWNLFEARVFDCNLHCNVTKIKETITNNMNLQELEEEPIVGIVLHHLQNRYTHDGETINGYNVLINQSRDNRDRDWKDLLKNVLLGTNTDKIDMITAIIIAIYRFRCNLFHGEKDIASLPNQNVNFDYSNKFIIACLTHKK